MSPTPFFTCLMPALIAVGCATMQPHLREEPVAAPPFFASYGPRVGPIAGKVGHLSVVIDPENRVQQGALQPLLAAVNAFLDSAGWSTPLDSAPPPDAEGPDIYVGVKTDGDSTRDGPPPMVVTGLAPSKRWQQGLGLIANAQRVEFVLVIRIGYSQYPLRRKSGITLNKELALGTEHVIPVGWLTDIETPAEVLHLTGALLTSDGKVLRAGAEGILGARPHWLLSLLDVTAAVSAREVQRLVGEDRREDLPGHPLTWQVALRNLVGNLLRRPDLLAP